MPSLNISPLDFDPCIDAVKQLIPVLLDIHKEGSQKYPDRISVDDDKVIANENHGLMNGVDYLPDPLVTKEDDYLSVRNEHAVPAVTKAVQWLIWMMENHTHPGTGPPILPPPPKEKPKKRVRKISNCNNPKLCKYGCPAHNIKIDDACAFRENVELCSCYIERRGTGMDAPCIENSLYFIEDGKFIYE